MKILKTMTTLAFACACLFTFAGCDWFGNSGTLIEDPTDTQLNAISGAVANMEAYTGDLQLLQVKSNTLIQMFLMNQVE